MNFIETYLDRFSGNPNWYAIRWDFEKSGVPKVAYIPSLYTKDKEAVQAFVANSTKHVGIEWGEKPALAHMRGELSLGIYVIRPDCTTSVVVLDYDGKDKDIQDIWTEVSRQQMLFDQYGVKTYIEMSRSGKGFHLWGFLEEPIDSGLLRHALLPLIESPDITTYDRMFPNQDGVNLARPYGNLIALPLYGPLVKQGKTAFWERAPDGSMVMVQDQKAFLMATEKVSRAKIQELADLRGTYEKKISQITIRDGSADGDLPGIYKVIHKELGCEWIRWCYENPEDVREPEWYAIACQFAQLEGGREAFHEFSALDEYRYNPQDTDNKFDHAIETNAPMSCQYIRESLDKNGPDCNCDKRFEGVYHPCDLAKVPFHRFLEDYNIDGTLVKGPEGLFGALESAKTIARGKISRNFKFHIASIDKYTELRPGDLIVFGARPGTGKALSLDSKLLTHDRGFIRMGDVKLGDTLIGGDGLPTKVIGVYPQGVKSLYKVTMTDGSSVECCEEHLWYTTTRGDRRKHAAGSVKTLREIMDTLRVGGVENRINHQVPTMAPAHFPEANLEIDPYTLGAYLGDGSWHSSGDISITNPEDDVLNRFREGLSGGDYATTYKYGTHCGNTIVRNPNGRKLGIRTELRGALARLGLAGKTSLDKFIPEAYLRGSIEQRLELLRGLLDTDGHMHDNGCTIEYSTSSPALARDVAFLAKSLGARITQSDRIPTYTYKGQKLKGARAYRIWISFPDNGLVPVTSAKHLAVWKPRERCFGEGIESVEYVGEKEAQCIMVDNDDHLYVTDDFIVTHNTAFLLDIALRNALEGVPCYIFSMEMTNEQLWKRILSNMAQVNGTRLMQGNMGFKEWRRVHKAIAQAKELELPIFVDDMAHDAEAVVDRAADLTHEHGKGIVFIDYLQMAANKPQESDYEKNSRVPRTYKRAAKVLETPFFVAAQLNRTAEEATEDSETFDSFYEGSGKIEQYADLGFFMLGPREPGIVSRTIIQHKDRHRESFHRMPLSFNQPLMRFEEKGYVPKQIQSSQTLPISVKADDFEY